MTRSFIALLFKLKPALMKIIPEALLRKAKNRVSNMLASNLSHKKPRPFQRGLFSDGVNLYGSIRAQSGLGQSCRLIADAMERSGIPFLIRNYEPLGTANSAESGWDSFLRDAVVHNINIFHINPHELPLALTQIGLSAWDFHYNIAYWLWELEEFPCKWHDRFALFDEIWTPAEFISAGIRKVTDLPVFTMPYPISAPQGESDGVPISARREQFGLEPGVFYVLSMYDCNSIPERKNPMGAIEAFKRAFSPDDNAGMVVKTSNSSARDLATLEKALVGYEKTVILRESLPKEQINSLIACCDAFVSLHRAEGFGLVCAEAMLLKTPVIASNWSANTEFMDETVAMMVDCALITLEDDIGPYEAGSRWADPDIGQAACHLRMLYKDREFGEALAARAKAHIQEKLSPEAAAARVKKRIKEIYAGAPMA